MNKRGQFFILVAVIICLMIFVIASRINTYEERILLEDFPDLSNNYAEESAKVANNAIFTGKDAKVALDDFTKNFTQYARTFDSKLGFVYAYRDRKTGAASIYNFNGNGEPIKIYDYNPETGAGAELDAAFADTTKSLSDISLDVGGFTFKKSVPIKVLNFDESYISSELTGSNFAIEMGGLIYPFNLDSTSLQVVAKSEMGAETRVKVGL